MSNEVSAEDRAILRLWEQDAPGALGKEDKDIPTLTVYLPDPDKATGAGIVVCPGGGYAMLAQHEGDHYARWLNEQGIIGLVLKYRLATDGYHHPSMHQDVSRALRYARANAGKWNLDPNRLGVMGSSAGGHLSSTILTHFDDGQPNSDDPVERQNSRPNLGILCYAVISMSTEIGHAGCRENLIGKDPSPDLVKYLSSELQVTPQTPPCFIWHTYEDDGVKVENSISFALALTGFKIPYELHVYQKGHHGLGLGSPDYNPDRWLPWTTECSRWLKEQGFGA